jgi:acetoin utilization deacetylase AcuC-like enzyme
MSISSPSSCQIDGKEIDLHRPFFPIYFNDVYEVKLPPNHRFPMEKYRKVRERVHTAIQSSPRREGKKVQCEFRVSPLVSIEDLTTTHCPKYVQRYIDGKQTEEELRNVGFPWSQQGVDRSFSSTGGTVAAATSICKARQLQLQGDLHENEWGLLFSAHVAGGTHHAFRDRGEGFCVFSDIAVAANVLLRDFSDIIHKILIVDLDVHQGNGNAVLFKDVKEVTTFSIQCDGNYFSEKQESDLDIDLPSGVTDETYLATLHHWLNRVRKGDAGDFDFIFFQAGVDILEEDRLGKMSITQHGIMKRNEMVFDLARDLNVPLCITMGGGYPRTDWEPILQAHANVYIQAYDYLSYHSRII